MDTLFTMAVSIILSRVKNENSKRKFKNVFLKVFNSIKLAYANDLDFQ